MARQVLGFEMSIFDDLWIFGGFEMTLRSRWFGDKAFSRAEFVSSEAFGKVVGSVLSRRKTGESSSEDHLRCHQGLEW